MDSTPCTLLFDSQKALVYSSSTQLLPPEPWLVNMSTPPTHFIGINVSGTQARAALVDSEGAVVEGRFGEVAPKQLVQELAAMVEDLGSRNVSVAAIGVAI